MALNSNNISSHRSRIYGAKVWAYLREKKSKTGGDKKIRVLREREREFKKARVREREFKKARVRESTIN